MYIHIFYGESGYSKTLLQILENHIDVKNHIVVFGFGKNINKEVAYSGKIETKYLSKNADLFFVIKKLRKADWIYIHFLQYNPTLLYWATQKSLLSRSTWIVWGSDVYSYYKRNNNIKTRLYEALRKIIISEIPEIAAFVKEDFDLIKELYKTKAEYMPILYPIPVNTEHLDKLKLNKSHIQTVFFIGNSGDKSNQHTEMIDLLSPFKEEKIKVICPLSYGGSKEYRESVINFGLEQFGDKFTPLLYYMNQEEYSQVLGYVDVALMNHKRQQALGNILALLYLEKKVFLRSEITSFSFLKRHNFVIFDIDRIKEMSFEQLTAMPENLSINKKIVKEIISEEYYLKLWMDLLNKH